MKQDRVQQYQKMQKYLTTITEIKDMLEFAKNDDKLYQTLMQNTEQFLKVLKEVEQEGDLLDPTYEKLMKTQTVMNEATQQIFLKRYGIAGVTLDEMEQVYNPIVSGIGSMQETREFLVSRGMSTAQADHLARQYIQRLEGKDA